MALTYSGPNWQREKADWPHAAHSQFVENGRHRWHVQRWGTGPSILFLHGTAASAHSFADLAENLSANFEVILVDLPGHGFTTSPFFWNASPEAIVQDLVSLLDRLGVVCQGVVGHSAGSVAALELASGLPEQPPLLVSINGAFQPFEGIAKFIAPVLAKSTYYNPIPIHAFAQAARTTGAVRRLIEQTGSTLPEKNIELYRRLLRCPGHIAGALHLMADWNHDRVPARAAAFEGRALLVTGPRDQAVPPAGSRKLMSHLPSARYEEVAGTGHLTHEERPEPVGELILREAREAGLI